MSTLFTEETCTIFGSEIEFKKEVPRADLEKVCQDIWDHPDQYSKWQYGTEEAWYNFIKFLWVKMPDGQVKRLTDFAVPF